MISLTQPSLICVRTALLLFALVPFSVRAGAETINCTACARETYRGASLSAALRQSTAVNSASPALPPPAGVGKYPRNGPAVPQPSAAAPGALASPAEIISATLIVTSAFPDYFYGQAEGAFWGMRVNYPGHDFMQDEKVAVRGTVVTGENGELAIDAISGTALGVQPVAPLSVSNRGVAGSGSPELPFGRYSHPGVSGGAGLGAPGVLLTTSGIVTAVSPDGGAMTIADGSAWGPLGMHDSEGNSGLRVFTPEGPLPPVGTFVRVTGVGSYYKSGAQNYPSVSVGSGPNVFWESLRKIRVHFLRIHDDDGSRQADITPEQAAVWIARANQVYTPLGVVFLYDPDTDFSDFNSTLLNNVLGNEDPDWNQSSGLANYLAETYFPGKMLVVVRQAVGGFSWWDLNFVAMPAYNTLHCGSLNTSLFSHEIGHYLGLWHTFPTSPFVSVSEAEQYFINHGKDPATFDGDTLPDTLPDPGIRTLECGSTSSVTLAGTVFQLPRDNLMSYYKDADTLSQLQEERALWTIDWRAGNKMPTPRNNPGGPGIVEAENALIISQSGCPFGNQAMTQWGAGNWSNGTQVFGGCGASGEISITFSLTQAGFYNVAAYMTHAPDYGIVGFFLDGVYVGSFDGYGPFVATSGRIPLTKSKKFLSAGFHTIKSKISGKNPKSWNYFMGIDCFQIQ